MGHPLLSPQQAVLLNCWAGNPPAAPLWLGQKPTISTMELHCCCSLRDQKNWEKKDVCYDMDRLGQNPGKTCMCLHGNGKLLLGQQFYTVPSEDTSAWGWGTEGLCSKTGVIHLNVIPSSSTWDLNVRLGSPWPHHQQERLCGCWSAVVPLQINWLCNPE